MGNPNTDRVLMEALRVLLPGYPVANTQLAVMLGQIVVQDPFSLSQGNFPSVLIEVGSQRHRLITTTGYDGIVKFDVNYLDRWDEQVATIDAIRTAIDADLNMMMHNIQINPSLAYNSQPHATSVPFIDLSPYKGEIDKDSVPGLTLVKRTMTLTVNILPYDA